MLYVRATFVRFAAAAALLAAAITFTARPAMAEEVFFADSSAWPGVLWKAESPHRLVEMLRRPAAPEPSSLQAVPKLGSMAFTPDGAVYFCSGLDGVVYVRDRQGERVFASETSQVRQVFYNPVDLSLYYSMAKTPIDREPLEDGVIRGRKVDGGQLVRDIAVRQADVGRDFWGSFAFFSFNLYVATHQRAEVFELRSTGAIPLYRHQGGAITGMAFTPTQDLLIADGSTKVTRVRNFRDAAIEYEFARPVTGVAVNTFDAYRP